MKHVLFSLAMIGVMMAAGGCIAPTTIKTNRFILTDREVVAVNDQVYVVDKSTGEVMELDISSAQPFVAESKSESE